MPLNPKGVTLGNGNDSLSGERRELKKATGNRCSMPKVIKKVNREGADCIEHK